MLTGLICFPANLCPLLRSVLFTPSSAVLLTSPLSPPFSSPFQFPLLKWDVVYRGECVHSLSAAPCTGIRWREIGLKWNRGVLSCKHPPPRNAGILCVRQANMRPRIYIVAKGWLKSPCFFCCAIILPVVLSLCQPLPTPCVSWHLYMSLHLSLWWSFSTEADSGPVLYLEPESTGLLRILKANNIKHTT